VESGERGGPGVGASVGAVEAIEDSALGASDVVVAVPGVSGSHKQRWSRDAYNAYMREYMKKRREK
jgi:hypothetical protein